MYKLGERSIQNINTCDGRLISVVHTAIGWTPYDFSIIEGHRTVERQQELYNTIGANGERVTLIDGITKKGNHNYYPSKAFDYLPYPSEVNDVNVWKDDNRFAVIAGVIFAAAAHHNVKIRWGGDWDGDGNAADQRLYDLPHIELVED